MRSPVLIFRPLRSWTVSSVRPGHSPALSMPILPANPGGAMCHVALAESPTLGIPQFYLRKRSWRASEGPRGGKRMQAGVRVTNPSQLQDPSALDPPPPGRRFRVPLLERLLWARPAAPSADHRSKRGGLATRASHLQVAELRWVLVTVYTHAHRHRHRETE